MGREEKRERARMVKQLERRLRRKPTDDEVEKALAALHETRRKRAGREPAR
jgi:DNA-directed RNA polymerase specialized sigma subunit